MGFIVRSKADQAALRKLAASSAAGKQQQHKRPRQAKARKPLAPRQSEADLLRQVLGWLKAKGLFAWRANAGGGLRDGRPIKGNPAGTPDVLLVIRGGRLVGIECKARGGKLRPAQQAWRERAEAAGVLYLEVRSLDQLIEALKREGVE